MLLNIFVLTLIVLAFLRPFFSDTKYLTREVFFVFAILIGIPLAIIYGPNAAEMVFGKTGLGGFQPVAGFLLVLSLIFLFAYVLSSGMAQWIGPKDKKNTSGKIILGLLSMLEGLLVVGSILFALSIFSEKLKTTINASKTSKMAVSFARWVYLDFVDVDKALETKKKMYLPQRITGSYAKIYKFPDSTVIEFQLSDTSKTHTTLKVDSSTIYYQTPSPFPPPYRKPVIAEEKKAVSK